MRIDAYNQISQIYKTTNKAKISKTSSVQGMNDQLQISSFGKDLQIAKQAVAKTPDIHEDLVNELRERIQNDSYEVSNESFAEKLMQKFAE